MHTLFANQLSVELAESLTSLGVTSISSDLDKVATNYNDTEVYDGAKGFFKEYLRDGRTAAIATNARNIGRLAAVSGELNNITIIHPDPSGNILSKPHPSMLHYIHRQENTGGKTAHLGDQLLKDGLAAYRAGVDYFVWVYPQGKLREDHIGTFALRALELPTRRIWKWWQNHKS